MSNLFEIPDYKKVRVIIDTDAACEADDPFAIVQALLSPKLIVKGIAAEHFAQENSMERSFEEIRTILDLMDMDVPVFKGQKGPLKDDGELSEASETIIAEALREDSKPLFILCQGAITNLPQAFGYDYYSIDHSSMCPRVENIQIKPSETYHALTDSAWYYYYPTSYDGVATNTSYPTQVLAFKGGDGRASVSSFENNGAMFLRNSSDTTQVYVAKVRTANVYLYRASTIYLHLAEALNAMGYTDIAFAILKNGISTYLENLVRKSNVDSEAYKYMSQKSVDFLGTTLPFLNAQYREIFNGNDVYGIHAHGSCTYNRKENELAQSAKGSRATALGSQMNTHYLPDVIIGEKMMEIARRFDVSVGTTKADSIAAMQDILCDEYAKEFAFEGRRFYDLQRIARHYNESGTWGGNFGSRWFVEKLSGNNPQKDLHDPRNWYLPFK